LLIIPVVLAVARYVINLTIRRGEQEATKQRAQSEREIAEDNQREEALQVYIDKISELILDKNLPNRGVRPWALALGMQAALPAGSPFLSVV
jgi:hypothetical protein